MINYPNKKCKTPDQLDDLINQYSIRAEEKYNSFKTTLTTEGKVAVASINVISDCISSRAVGYLKVRPIYEGGNVIRHYNLNGISLKDANSNDITTIATYINNNILHIKAIPLKSNDPQYIGTLALFSKFFGMYGNQKLLLSVEAPDFISSDYSDLNNGITGMLVVNGISIMDSFVMPTYTLEQPSTPSGIVLPKWRYDLKICADSNGEFNFLLWGTFLTDTYQGYTQILQYKEDHGTNVTNAALGLILFLNLTMNWIAYYKSSSNTDIHIIVEPVYGGIDFQKSIIKRPEFLFATPPSNWNGYSWQIIADYPTLDLSAKAIAKNISLETLVNSNVIEVRAPEKGIIGNNTIITYIPSELPANSPLYSRSNTKNVLKIQNFNGGENIGNANSFAVVDERINTVYTKLKLILGNNYNKLNDLTGLQDDYTQEDIEDSFASLYNTIILRGRMFLTEGTNLVALRKLWTLLNNDLIKTQNLLTYKDFILLTFGIKSETVKVETSCGLADSTKITSELLGINENIKKISIGYSTKDIRLYLFWLNTITNKPYIMTRLKALGLTDSQITSAFYEQESDTFSIYVIEDTSLIDTLLQINLTFTDIQNLLRRNISGIKAETPSLLEMSDPTAAEELRRALTRKMLIPESVSVPWRENSPLNYDDLYKLMIFTSSDVWKTLDIESKIENGGCSSEELDNMSFLMKQAVSKVLKLIQTAVTMIRKMSGVVQETLGNILQKVYAFSKKLEAIFGSMNLEMLMCLLGVGGVNVGFTSDTIDGLINDIENALDAVLDPLRELKTMIVDIMSGICFLTDLIMGMLGLPSVPGAECVKFNIELPDCLKEALQLILDVSNILDDIINSALSGLQSIEATLTTLSAGIRLQISSNKTACNEEGTRELLGAMQDMFGG